VLKWGLERERRDGKVHEREGHEKGKVEKRGEEILGWGGTFV
jgi:hypothetical protein